MVQLVVARNTFGTSVYLQASLHTSEGAVSWDMHGPSNRILSTAEIVVGRCTAPVAISQLATSNLYVSTVDMLAR